LNQPHFAAERGSVTDGQLIPGVHHQQQVEDDSMKNSMANDSSNNYQGNKQQNMPRNEQQFVQNDSRYENEKLSGVRSPELSGVHPGNNGASQQQQPNSQQQAQSQQQAAALTAVMASGAPGGPNQHLMHPGGPPNQLARAAAGMPPQQPHLNPLMYLQTPTMAQQHLQAQQHLAGFHQQHMQQQQQHRNSLSGPPPGHEFNRSNSQEVNGGNGGK